MDERERDREYAAPILLSLLRKYKIGDVPPLDQDKSKKIKEGIREKKESEERLKELEEGTQPSRDIWVIPSVGVEPVLFLGTEFDERHPRFSPDGDWIAFTSDRPGQDEVYVKSFPGPSGFRKCCKRRTPTQDGELP